MGARVVITIDGVDKVISNLGTIGEKAGKNVQSQTDLLGRDTKQVWIQNTPKGKTGRLSGGDVVEPGTLSFTLKNSVYYYKFVNDGHNTPAGWRTKHGYRAAKRRSHVEGREMTEKAVEFIEQNIKSYLSKFLDNA